MAVATQGRVIKDGYKVGLSLREIFRRVVAEVIWNFRNKIHPIWGLLLANQCIHTPVAHNRRPPCHELPVRRVPRRVVQPQREGGKFKLEVAREDGPECARQQIGMREDR